MLCTLWRFTLFCVHPANFQHFLMSLGPELEPTLVQELVAITATGGERQRICLQGWVSPLAILLSVVFHHFRLQHFQELATITAKKGCSVYNCCQWRFCGTEIGSHHSVAGEEKQRLCFIGSVARDPWLQHLLLSVFVWSLVKDPQVCCGRN